MAPWTGIEDQAEVREFLRSCRATVIADARHATHPTEPAAALQIRTGNAS